MRQPAHLERPIDGEEVRALLKVQIVESVTGGKGAEGGDAVAEEDVGSGEQVKVDHEVRWGGQVQRMPGHSSINVDRLTGRDQRQVVGVLRPVELVVQGRPEGSIVQVGGNVQVLNGRLRVAVGVVAVQGVPNRSDQLLGGGQAEVECDEGRCPGAGLGVVVAVQALLAGEERLQVGVALDQLTGSGLKRNEGKQKRG